MILLGVAFLVFAALVGLASLSVVVSALIVGAGCVVLGLIMGERNIR